MRARNQQGTSVLVIVWMVLTLVTIVGIGWYVWSHPIVPETQSDAAPSVQGDGWSSPVVSGKGAFSVRFPDGWVVSKDTASDAFMIGGETQPTTKLGVPAKVTSTQFGSDGPVVLFITGVNGLITPPRGDATSFTLNDKDSPVTGTRYAYEYPADTADGMGARIRGDRDYTYLFDLGAGKHLEILYSVYGSDPRNNVETIDALVRTIQLN